MQYAKFHPKCYCIYSLKVKDNVVRVILVQVFIKQSTTAPSLAYKLLQAMVKVLNALVIKQGCMPSGKLKATKLLPELNEVGAQQQHQLHLPMSVVPW